MYVSYFQEQIEDKEIRKVIKSLIDEMFGNYDQRRKFAKLILTLAHSRDPEARKVIKYLGDKMSEYEITKVPDEITRI